MAIQCGIWDRVRDVDRQPETHITNLAKFIAFLILEKALPLSVLKVKLQLHYITLINNLLLTDSLVTTGEYLLLRKKICGKVVSL